MTWHLDRQTADAYVRRATDHTTSSSVETHLVACAECQRLISAAVDPALDAWLADVWMRIDDELDHPRTTWVERALLSVGCSGATARIVTASSSARLSYLMAVAVSVVLAIGAAQSGRDAAFGVFLVLAPIGPLVATAGAFGRWTDPLHALLGTLPTSPWRIALLRTVTTVVPAIALTATSIPILDERGWLAVAWLLPALALGASTLALATWIRIEAATLVVGAAWLALPIVLRVRAVDLIDAMGGPAQPAAVVAIVFAATVVAVRRETLEYPGIP